MSDVDSATSVDTCRRPTYTARHFCVTCRRPTYTARHFCVTCRRPTYTARHLCVTCRRPTYTARHFCVTCRRPTYTVRHLYVTCSRPTYTACHFCVTCRRPTYTARHFCVTCRRPIYTARHFCVTCRRSTYTARHFCHLPPSYVHSAPLLLTLAAVRSTQRLVLRQHAALILNCCFSCKAIILVRLKRGNCRAQFRMRRELNDLLRWKINYAFGTNGTQSRLGWW
jgi:lysine/ornithine N-monooxygenase